MRVITYRNCSSAFSSYLVFDAIWRIAGMRSLWLWWFGDITISGCIC